MSSMTMSKFDWQSLPEEMKLAVLDNLSLSDVWSYSKCSRDSYSTCLPILFHSVELPTVESVNSFLDAVPAHHCQLIRDLRVSTQSRSHISDHCDAFIRPSIPTPDTNTPLAQLLSRCSSLESLSIKAYGGLNAATMLQIFQGQGMQRIRSLGINNMDQEELAPISERIIVSIAFSLPKLESLSLTRITRSALHASELLFSSVPLAQDTSSDIPAHPFLGDELRLPQLLRLPKLKQMRVRDTHLGDPLWEDVSCECPLEVLDLGSCAYVSPRANEVYATKILARVPPTITSCALSTSLPSEPLANSATSPISPICNKPSSPFSGSPLSPVSPAAAYPLVEADLQAQIPPLPRLRTLHLTPLVPTASLSTTLSQPALAASPVQTLSCSFHPDDAADGLRELEGFLKEREAREKVLRLAQGVKQGRRRASSRLSLSSHVADNDEALPITRARANTVDTSSSLPVVSLPPVVSPTRLYPSLSTLTIEIPQEPQSSASPTAARLSPRRLAAARRRAEERREAAMRVKEVAEESGMRVVFRGVELDEEGKSGVAQGAASARMRAYTAF